MESVMAQAIDGTVCREQNIAEWTVMQTITVAEIKCRGKNFLQNKLVQTINVAETKCNWIIFCELTTAN